MSQLFSQSQSQVQRPACAECGGTEYILEFGHYYCADCQLQSQDIREEVFDEFAGGHRGTKLILPTLKSQEVVATNVSITADKPEATSWEVLNIVLLGLVNELILLGAPKELKIVALQLWARYLKSIEVAFISKNVEKRPRLNLTFRRRDAQLVYGTDYEIIKTQKRPVFRPKRRRSRSLSESLSSSSTGHANRRMEKYRLTLKKKKLATAEYAASTTASSQGSELTLENLSARRPSISSQKTQKSTKLHYNPNARTALLDLLDNAAIVEDFDRNYLQKRCFYKHKISLDHATMINVFAILRISLLILDSDIHLGDLLRWSDEGYLSLLNAEKLIPVGIKVANDVKALFITKLYSRRAINLKVMSMIYPLKLSELKSRILPIIQRYLKELCLPGEMYVLIKQFLVLQPPQLQLTASVNYEAWALSYIILVLKFLFGLDGVTERRISRFASFVNRHEKGSNRLFNWAEWVHFINCRNSFLSVHHQVSRDIYYPTSRFGGASAFLSHWEKIPAKQTLSREHVIDSDLSDCMRRFMKGLCQEPTEPLPPSLAPFSTMMDTLMKRNTNIPHRAKLILQHDFTFDSIGYLIDKKRQKEICEKYNAIILPYLAANFVKVKPVSVDTSKAVPSIRGKKNVRIILTDTPKLKPKESEQIKTGRRELSTKKSCLPDIESILRGVFLRNKYSCTEDELSLPSLGRGYWVYHGSFSNARTQAATFDYLAETVFPPDFLWLLKEAANLGHMSTQDLYSHLTKLEKTYLQSLPNAKKKAESIATST